MIDRVRDSFPGTDTTAAGFEQPTVYPATVDAARADAAARSPWRVTLIALVLTLLLGVAAGGWAAMRWFAPATAAPAASRGPDGVSPSATMAGVRSAATAPPPGAAAGVAATALPATAAETPMMSARIAVLEERLARISIAADSASGNAAKAEAILVAFAARRALDRGVGLGSMDAQLRLRFGETQPNAVDSILSAAANPITQEELVQRLDGVRALAIADGNGGWLTRIGDGLSSLVSIRRSDAPSADPTMRYDRAMRAVINGRVDQAIVEVEAMPGRNNQAVQYWLRDARRYYDARRALDLIETAALVEPGVNRGVVAP